MLKKFLELQLNESETVFKKKNCFQYFLSLASYNTSRYTSMYQKSSDLKRNECLHVLQHACFGNEWDQKFHSAGACTIHPRSFILSSQTQRHQLKPTVKNIMSWEQPSGLLLSSIQKIEFIYIYIFNWNDEKLFYLSE